MKFGSESGLKYLDQLFYPTPSDRRIHFLSHCIVSRLDLLNKAEAVRPCDVTAYREAAG